MMAWVDGHSVTSADVPHPDVGRFAPFETMGAENAGVRLWPRHVARLGAAAERLGLSFEATPDLRAASGVLLLDSGHADGILRLALLPVGDTTHVAMTTRLRSPATRVTLLPTVIERPQGAPPADLKAVPRDYYDSILQQAQDGGADDGIVVADDGAVLQTALANLWLLLDGVWTTPPLDGRVLPGIARAILLEQAASAGLAITERTVDLESLHHAEAIAVSNAVYGPRAASLLGPTPPAVEVVDSSLGSLWRAAASGGV